MYEFAVAPAVTQIRRRGVEITDVAPASLAFELELEAGDRIIKVNGRVVRDYLDFRFQTGGETELVLEVRKKSGEEWEWILSATRRGFRPRLRADRAAPVCQRMSLLLL